MNITSANLYDIQDRMGDAATKAEAQIMLGILSRECVTDTDDVSESQWLEWCEEAAATAANEAACAADIEGAHAPKQTVKLQTAQQFFLPAFEGDSSAFQPYYLGELKPSADDMDELVLSTLEAAAQHFSDNVGKRNTIRLATKAYREDGQYAQALRAWCLAQAQAAYAE